MRDILISSSLVIIASFFFVLNDAIINYLSPRGIKFFHFVFYGSPIYFLIPLYLLIKGNIKEKLKCQNYFIPLFRSILFAPMPYIAFVSLKNISLPEYTTLNMSAPIFGSILGIFLLKEKFNLILFLSLLVGTTGVLFVVQPGFDAFNPYFILVLFGSFIITSNTILINKYHNLSASQSAVESLIIISSVFINGAILIMTIALQRSQKYFSSVFCLVYFQILYSILVGYFFFGEYLYFYAIIGAFLIVLSGMLSLPSQYKQINN